MESKDMAHQEFWQGNEMSSFYLQTEGGPRVKSKATWDQRWLGIGMGCRRAELGLVENLFWAQTEQVEMKDGVSVSMLGHQSR